MIAVLHEVYLGKPGKLFWSLDVLNLTDVFSFSWIFCLLIKSTG
jgi:hypothetical protein